LAGFHCPHSLPLAASPSDNPEPETPGANPGAVTSFPESSMSSKLEAYAWFLAFMVVTSVVVRPIATQMSIPLLKDI
jgi:hypothetical protein